MNTPKLHVGDVVEAIDLDGYKHNGKHGTILRLKRLEGEEYADVSLYGEKRCKQFLAFHLKRVDAVQGEIPNFGDF
jgi:hypothetical protein